MAFLSQSLGIAIFYVNVGSFFTFHAYRWDKSNSSFTCCKSSRKWRIARLFWYSIVWSYLAFLAFSCNQLLSDPKASMLLKVRLIYMTCAYGQLSLGFFLLLQHHGHHHTIFNQLFDFVNIYGSQCNIKKDLKRLNRVLWAITLTCCFGTTNAISVIQTPGSHRLVTSLFENPSTKVKIVAFIYHFVHNGIVMYCTTFYFVALACYVCLLMPIVRRLERQDVTSERTRGFIALLSPVSPTDFRKCSDALLVLEAGFTSVFGAAVLLFLVFSSFVVLMNTFQCVIFTSIRSLVLALMFTGIMATASKTAGDLFETSTKVKKSWKGLKDPQWLSRYLRALRPARVPIGSFFYFDKGIWPTVFNMIISQAVNLIVTYREEM